MQVTGGVVFRICDLVLLFPDGIWRDDEGKVSSHRLTKVSTSLLRPGESTAGGMNRVSMAIVFKTILFRNVTGVHRKAGTQANDLSWRLYFRSV